MPKQIIILYQFTNACLISAVVFGDPHFVTFDGVSYSFNGKGEYTLVVSEQKQLVIQGRTEPVNGENNPPAFYQNLCFILNITDVFLALLGTVINATKLTSVAMREASSDIVEVRLGHAHNGLEVLQNQQTLSFTEQSWMDLHGELPFVFCYFSKAFFYIFFVPFPTKSPPGVFVFSPTSTNVTVMFPSGAGVEVRLRGVTVTTTVLLPEEFKGSTLGLLGNMNSDVKDDLVFSTGQSVQNHTDPVELFNFGASCKKSLHMKCCRKLIYCVIVLWAGKLAI